VDACRAVLCGEAKIHVLLHKTRATAKRGLFTVKEGSRMGHGGLILNSIQDRTKKGGLILNLELIQDRTYVEPRANGYHGLEGVLATCQDGLCQRQRQALLRFFVHYTDILGMGTIEGVEKPTTQPSPF